MAGAHLTEERARVGAHPTGAPSPAVSGPQPIVVEVADLSVRLSLQKERVTSLRERAIRFLERRPVETEEFWPVRNVSFEVRRGEAFGIVGRNGAGKSTLLKVIAGVIGPTLGRVVVKGRIAPLLELGAGFDPEMTGRENIFLYGSLLGFPRRKLVERFGHIVEFAELEPFIDVPLKNYSSGMYARLGFAVATEVDADVLIVDEALTVGDSRFQLKCLERIEAFRARGVSILFVSHNLEQVRRLCSHAIWLDNSDVVMSGQVDDVMAAYAAGEYDPPARLAAGPAPREPAHAAEVDVAEPDASRCDFIDLSRGDGSSVWYSNQRFGGRGVAISQSPVVVEGARRYGADGVLIDPLAVDFPPGCVRYVSLMDSLQFLHLPEELEAVLARASRWARDFIFIRMPSFEDEEYLRSLGLKWYWTDWSTLPNHPRLDQVTAIFNSLGLDQYNVKYRLPTLSSDVSSLLPLAAPPDQGFYDPEIHGPKPSVAFPRPLYAQVDIFIALRAFDPKEWCEAIRPDFPG